MRPTTSFTGDRAVRGNSTTVYPTTTTTIPSMRPIIWAPDKDRDRDSAVTHPDAVQNNHDARGVEVESVYFSRVDFIF